MGIFDFIKDAGAKILDSLPIGDDGIQGMLRKHVESHGISTEGLDFKVHGEGVVTVTGQVADQDTREKLVLLVGNVNGVNQVDDRLTLAATGGVSATVAEASPNSPGASAEAWASKTYTVERGDTLSGIAKKMYGNAGKYPVIFEANKPMLSDPDKIYPGQVLRIPPLND